MGIVFRRVEPDSCILLRLIRVQLWNPRGPVRPLQFRRAHTM